VGVSDNVLQMWTACHRSEPNREARADTKKGGQNRLPRFACHYANRPFFQDI